MHPSTELDKVACPDCEAEECECFPEGYEGEDLLEEECDCHLQGAGGHDYSPYFEDFPPGQEPMPF